MGKLLALPLPRHRRAPRARRVAIAYPGAVVVYRAPAGVVTRAASEREGRAVAVRAARRRRPWRALGAVRIDGRALRHLRALNAATPAPAPALRWGGRRDAR
jgi:hypothetical protein